MANAPVPLLDLKAQFDPIADELLEAVTNLIKSQQFILGPVVEKFESAIADYCQTKHCLGVTSGSDALLLALMALDIKAGDEVITTPYSFFATVGAIVRAGATPVMVDIDPMSYNIDPSQIEDAITPKTKAIMPVHLFGRCAEMTKINDIAARHGLYVIEDAAQAIGAEHLGERAGTMGSIGCFSFFPSKNLGAFGDAGAVTTNDSVLHEKMKSLRMHGERVRYYHQYVGANFRIDALQAAVLHVKLKYLDDWSTQRQKNARYYDRLLMERGLAGNSVITPPAGPSRHIFNQYIIRVSDRDALRQSLTEAQIGTQIYYPVPLHLQECFTNLGYREGSFPHSEKAAKQTLALPIYPELTRSQIEQVVDGIAKHYQQAGQLERRRAA